MKINKSKFAFGRHETFFCRIGWLTKGFWRANEHLNESESDFFRQDNAVVNLGVGKNMVASIKYWLLAAQLFETSSKGIAPSQLGTLLLGNQDNEGWDSYFEDTNSLWLLHWLIASNSEVATTFFWFFNLYHKSTFTVEELKTALFDFIKDNLSSTPSVATLKNDVSVLVRSYVDSRADKKAALEDTLDSPLSELNLIQFKSGKDFSSSIAEKDISPYIIGFALSQIFEAKEAKSLPVEQLIYSRELNASIGSVFRLPENNALALIERAIDLLPGYFNINESAGIHQVYKDQDFQALDYLRAYYQGVKK